MKPENVACPACGGSMVSRKNHRDGRRFWGCANYPECRGTRDTDGRSSADRASSSGEGIAGESGGSRRWDGL
jgi:ssDNA-binding Zn-finger/Zn-ribbon topoisomerase 1